jgi:hypothetical protein
MRLKGMRPLSAATVAFGVVDIRHRARLCPCASRWLLGIGALALTSLAGAQMPVAAQGSPPIGTAAQPAPATFSDAVQVLAREQSAAEQYAVILDRFGKNDTSRYVQGITRYAEAKADFDGLIEALKTDLVEGHSPSSSPKLGEALRAAAEKRIAFTSFVSDQVIGDKEGGKGIIPDVVSAVPDLIKALTDAGISIWREYAAAGKSRRDEIRDELDHLKWQPFADIAKT